MSKESKTYHSVRDELQSVREAREDEAHHARAENKILRGQTQALRLELEEVRGRNLDLHRKLAEH